MSHQIKHADVVPEGLYVILEDGREAMLDEQELIDCAENNDSFAEAAKVHAQADADDAEDKACAASEHS